MFPCGCPPPVIREQGGSDGCQDELVRDGNQMRIMIVDDHVLFREGLAGLLNAEPDMSVVAQAGSVREAIAQAHEHKPDVVLMDFSLPDGSGADASESILQELPDCKIVFLTVYEADDKLLAAIRSGAKGYLLKNVPISKLISSLHGLEEGEAALSRKMTSRLLAELSRDRQMDEGKKNSALLSDRELDVLRELAGGATNREIAQKLFISENTVKHHMHNILVKLEVRNRREAVELARRMKLVGKLHQ
jgi:DNA-binding NarL/FixJ family response regulator